MLDVHQFKRLFNQYGITRISDVTDLDVIGIPVFNSIRPNSKSISVSSGRALNKKDAFNSAMMESIETYYAEEPECEKIVASREELLKLGNSVCDPRYISRAPNTKLNNKSKISWTKLKEISNGRIQYFPYDLVHLDMTIKTDFTISSAGIAASKDKKYALTHAMYELLEHDSYTLWCLKNNNDKANTFVQPELIDSEIINHLNDKILRQDLSLYIFNITTNLRVPTFLSCIISNEFLLGGSCSGVGFTKGLGCSLNGENAILRSITEAAQSRVGVISAARDDFSVRTFEKIISKNWLSFFLELKSMVNKLQNKLTYNAYDEFGSETELKTLVNSVYENTGFMNSIFYTELNQGCENHVFRVIIPNIEGNIDYANYYMGPRARKIIKYI